MASAPVAIWRRACGALPRPGAPAPCAPATIGEPPRSIALTARETARELCGRRGKLTTMRPSAVEVDAAIAVVPVAPGAATSLAWRGDSGAGSERKRRR